MPHLHVKKITIDIIPIGEPFIEIIVDKHITDESGDTIQIIAQFGKVYKRISELNHIPIGNIADDGYVDNFELMGLVGHAALVWVAMEFNGVLNAKGQVVVE